MGHAGFIGSHLVDALVSPGFEVTVLEDASTRKSLESITLKRGYILDYREVKQVMGGVEVVFHETLP